MTDSREDRAPRLIKALHDLRVWLETEGCSDQVEVIDDALVDCGIFEVRCANCDGVGEWDEGPLAATSRHQISPDYRHMVCSDCNGTGVISIAPATECPTSALTQAQNSSPIETPHRGSSDVFQKPSG